MKKLRFISMMCLLALFVVSLTGCKKEENNTNNGSGSNQADYVDLGLPSGIQWATCNVGAETPEGYGTYFAWGETQPKSDYSWATYKYCVGGRDRLTKYCNVAEFGNEGFIDNLFFLQPTDDAATVNWGGKWRTPTCDEWSELWNNCDHVMTVQNGVHGMLLTSQFNGKTIFFPAASNYDGVTLIDVDARGSYWLSDLFKMSYPYAAWFVIFSINDYVNTNYDSRCMGRTVRPVRFAQ